MTAQISVVAIRPVTGAGATRAFCDVAIGGVKVMGVKVVEQEGKAPWAAMPSTKGRHGWTQVVTTLSKPLQENVREIVLAERRGDPTAEAEGLNQPPEPAQPVARPGGFQEPAARIDELARGSIAKAATQRFPSDDRHP